MEDTAWPHPGQFDNYLEKAGTLYLETLRVANERMHGSVSRTGRRIRTRPPAPLLSRRITGQVRAPK